jgi:hypothetical protein
LKDICILQSDIIQHTRQVGNEFCRCVEKAAGMEVNRSPSPRGDKSACNLGTKAEGVIETDRLKERAEKRERKKRQGITQIGTKGLRFNSIKSTAKT